MRYPNQGLSKGISESSRQEASTAQKERGTNEMGTPQGSLLRMQSVYGNRRVLQLMKATRAVGAALPIQRSWQTGAIATEHDNIKKSTMDSKMVATLHHIIPREKMEKIAGYAEIDNTPASKLFLTSIVDLYETLTGNLSSGVSPSKAMQNLPFNLAPGPAAEKVLNNPGAAYDPQTIKVDQEKSDVSADYGFNDTELDGLEYEYREDTAVSDKMLEIMNLVNRTGERDDTFWNELTLKINAFSTNINAHKSDEWNAYGNNDEYTRKRPGLNVTKDNGNVLRSIIGTLQAPAELINIQIAPHNNVTITVKPINVKHILERHSLRHFTGQVLGENSFFPLQMSKDDIKNIVKDNVESKIGDYIEALTTRLKNVNYDGGTKLYAIKGNDVELTFADGESYIYFSVIDMVQYEDNGDIEVDATIATYAPQGPDSIHIPKQVLEAALR